MQLLFEEGGEIRAGTVLSQQGEAYQVELPSAKRAKVKSRDVLLQFAQPSAGELAQAAQALSSEIDLDFLWECAPAEEFGFTDLAGEYFGTDADATQQAALAIALHGSPVYFRRKGRGRYQRAPEDQLKAAFAGLERKKQQAAQQAAYEAELKAMRLPEAFRGKALQLLFKPDKNSIEFKAFDAACTALGMSPMRLMVAVGGIANARALHEARFLSECFPKGIGFPDVTVPEPALDLPVADVRAFSIDDVTTTEIDDAISVTPLDAATVRIGIHIAAPGFGIQRGEALDAIARQRLSTVYFPGDKITMLPESVVDRYTLQEGRACPALSLYVTVDRATWAVSASETRCEIVTVAANLRHNLLDEIVTAEALAAGTGDYPFKDELAVLWPFAGALYDARQQARIASGLKPEGAQKGDYSFYLDPIPEAEGGGERIRIEQRKRGSPLDKIVAELMILANSTWGRMLADAGVPGIYRTQKAWGMHRTRMQTYPAPHEGLGVAQYAWSTSPLRRYVDLVNQWQIAAVAQHGVMAKLVAPFAEGCRPACRRGRLRGHVCRLRCAPVDHGALLVPALAQAGSAHPHAGRGAEGRHGALRRDPADDPGAGTGADRARHARRARRAGDRRDRPGSVVPRGRGACPGSGCRGGGRRAGGRAGASRSGSAGRTPAGRRWRRNPRRDRRCCGAAAAGRWNVCRQLTTIAV